MATDQKPASNVFYLTQLLEDDGTITKLAPKDNKDASSAITQDSTDALLTQLTESITEPLLADIESAIFPKATDSNINMPAFEAVHKHEQQQECKMTQDAQNSPAADMEFGHIGDDTSTQTSNPDIASKETLLESAASLGTLAEMARKIQSQPAPQNAEPVTSQNVGDYTVDALMREMLKPLLKDWLDANLPSLVKWIVTEQIENMRCCNV